MQHAGNKIYYSISMGAFDEEEKKVIEFMVM